MKGAKKINKKEESGCQRDKREKKQKKQENVFRKKNQCRPTGQKKLFLFNKFDPAAPHFFLIKKNK